MNSFKKVERIKNIFNYVAEWTRACRMPCREFKCFKGSGFRFKRYEH